MLETLSDRLQTLGLVEEGAATTPPTQDEFLKGIIEEVTLRPVEGTLQQNLTTMGYTGDSHDRTAIINFLVSTLQAHRILSHRSDRMNTTHISPDVNLSRQISRFCRSVDIPPVEHADPDASTLAQSIQSATTAFASLPNPDHLTKPLLSPEDRTELDDPARKRNVENILSVLADEHTTRIGLLLTRLRVTVQAFSRNARAMAQPSAFSPLSRRTDALMRTWRHPRPITLLHTVCAPRFALADVLAPSSADESPHHAVKHFVMGDVPDRGGRLTGSSVEMPRFSQRQDVEPDHGRGRWRDKKKRKGRS